MNTVRTEDVGSVRHVIISSIEKRMPCPARIMAPLDRLDAATADLAGDVMANGDNAVGLAKRLLDAAAKPALALTLEMELTAQDSLVRTEGFAQGGCFNGSGNLPWTRIGLMSPLCQLVNEWVGVELTGVYRHRWCCR